MRRLAIASLLAPLALFAQAPAPAPAAQAAPAPAPAPSLADQFKAAAPGIAALRATDPDTALAKAEALIPAVPPAFNKADFSAAQDSVAEYSALTDIYRTAASCADAAGQWEKAKDYATKAKANCQLTYENAQVPFGAFEDTWKKAKDEAQKSLDEEAALAKTEKPTPEQTQRLEFLKRNEAVFQKNVSQGNTMISAVEARLKDLREQPADFDPFIANITQRLSTEADNIQKFKGDKKAFAAAAMKGADAYTDKASEITYLRRLQVLSPEDKAIAHKINVLLGKEKDEPAKKAPSRRAVRHKKGH